MDAVDVVVLVVVVAVVSDTTFVGDVTERADVVGAVAVAFVSVALLIRDDGVASSWRTGSRGCCGCVRLSVSVGLIDFSVGLESSATTLATDSVSDIISGQEFTCVPLESRQVEDSDRPWLTKFFKGASVFDAGDADTVAVVIVAAVVVGELDEDVTDKGDAIRFN